MVVMMMATMDCGNDFYFLYIHLSRGGGGAEMIYSQLSMQVANCCYEYNITDGLRWGLNPPPLPPPPPPPPPPRSATVQ